MYSITELTSQPPIYIQPYALPIHCISVVNLLILECVTKINSIVVSTRRTLFHFCCWYCCCYSRSCYNRNIFHPMLPSSSCKIFKTFTITFWPIYLETYTRIMDYYNINKYEHGRTKCYIHTRWTMSLNLV